MRSLILAALFALAACATAQSAGPSLRYADAASRGAAALLAGGQAVQVERATQDWSHALGDSFACGYALRVNAGSRARWHRGDECGRAWRRARGARAQRAGGDAGRPCVERRERPSQARWVSWPHGAARGRRWPRSCAARSNGLMEEEYGLLMALLGS